MTTTDPKKRPRGPDLNFRRHTNFDGMTPQSTHAAEVANYERLKASRPLKPPGRRAQ